MATVQRYHSRTSSSRSLTSPHGADVSSHENYAFDGFDAGNYYINSDRKIKLNEHFQRADGQPLQGYGLEIETVCDGIVSDPALAEVYRKIVFPVFKFGDVQFKMQEDCTLRGHKSSAEVITQVMTKSRIRNDYAAYQTMFDVYFPAFQISADSFRTTCGMHVNISNACFGTDIQKQQEAIRKFYYFVNKHYDFSLCMFYRDPQRTGYCGQQPYDIARNIVLEGNDIGQWHGGPSAVNLSHYDAGRIELRIVGGQKKYYTFRNTMECVFWLVERVRTASWQDLDSIVKMFKGCNQYVLKRLEDCHLSADDFAAIEAAVKPENLELQRA